MQRPTALALVCILWAVIYLPGLGSTELKGEEGRRILPAITMLESGNWLVPYVGGEPFLRKPPLVNWLIALSFQSTGVRNEWTARLPSALCVLLLGLTIVGVAAESRGKWLTVPESLAAALMAMTQFGLLAKARFAGAEIEGIYAPLCGMAIVWWLAGWAREWSPWRLWFVPGVLLGLGCLAKGPSLHLVFFYAIVMAVLRGARKLRALWHPAHFVALAVTAGIFATWAVPYFQTPEAAGAEKVWKRQAIDRFTDSEFRLANYLTNVPRALGDQLPWLLLLLPGLVTSLRAQMAGGPEIRRAAGVPPAGEAWNMETPALTAAVAPTVCCFFGVLLVPGALPRYVLPLGAPIALILTRRLMASRRVADPVRLVAGITVVLAAAMVLYALFIVPRMNARDDLRPLAREIDAAIPPGATLIIHDPGYLAAIFYLRTMYRYTVASSEIPPDAGWILARQRAVPKLREKRPEFREVRAFPTSDGRALVLLRSEFPAESRRKTE